MQETAQHQEGTQSETEATTIEAQADQQPEKQLTRELPSQTDGYQKTDAEWSFDTTGFTFKVPERFKDYKGQ